MNVTVSVNGEPVVTVNQRQLYAKRGWPDAPKIVAALKKLQ